MTTPIASSSKLPAVTTGSGSGSGSATATPRNPNLGLPPGGLVNRDSSGVEAFDPALGSTSTSKNPADRPAPDAEEQKYRSLERQRLLALNARSDAGRKEPHKPRILISSEELNILIYSYLCESEFPHTAYAFRGEARLDRSEVFRGLGPDRRGRFPGGDVGGDAAATQGRETEQAQAGGKGKDKGKGKEDPAPVDEGDKMDVDLVEDDTAAAIAAVPPTATTTTEGGKRKPALKRKGSDKPPHSISNSGTNTPKGPETATTTTGVTGPAQGVVHGKRTREERHRAVPRGELIRHLYKGLMWDEVEKHAQYGWSESPPCVSPFTLLSHHECLLAPPRPGQAPIIPPILINRKTNTPIFSAILTPEERARLAQPDIFPPAAEGSRLERLERVLGERESHVMMVRRIREEEKHKLKQELREERRRERSERRARGGSARRAREDADAEDEKEDEGMDMGMDTGMGMDMDMDVDVEEEPEPIEPRQGKRRQVDQVDEVPDIRVNGPGPSASISTGRDKERRERDRDKDRPRERDKPTSGTTQGRTNMVQSTTAATPATVNTPPTFGKKKKRVLSSDETDMPTPNGAVAAARTKKREETDRASPVAVNGNVKEKKAGLVKREEDRGKSRDEDFVPKKRKVPNGDGDSGRKEREMLGIGPGPGRPSKTSRIVSESTLTESETDGKRPAKKTGRARRNSNASNNTKSERSGERQDGRSVSQTPVPTVGTSIKAIFAGQKNPLQPVERDGMLCWRGHTKKINRVSWNPLNLTRLISCSQDGLCNIWDFADPLSSDDRRFRLLARIPIELVHRALQAKNPVVDLAWNNDGNAFVTIDKENVARSFVGDGELQGTGYRHGREITCVAWNPNGNYFATTNIDGQTCVWDISVVPIKLKNSWDHHAPHKAYHVDWLTNEIFATCSEDCTIVICSVNAVDRLATLSKHQDRVLVCKFSPKHRPEDKLPAGVNFSTGTRRLLASGSDDHTVRIWDMQALEDEGASIFSEPRDPAKQPKELLTLEGHVDDIQLIQWCPRLQKDGKRLLVTMSMADPQSDSNDRHVIKMYDINARDGKHCLYTITEHREEIRALEFSPEGDLFLSCAEDGMLNIWQTETGQLKKRFSASSSIYDAKWRPDGEQLALAMSDGTLRTIYVGDLLRRSST